MAQSKNLPDEAGCAHSLLNNATNGRITSGDLGLERRELDETETGLDVIFLSGNCALRGVHAKRFAHLDARAAINVEKCKGRRGHGWS